MKVHIIKPYDLNKNLGKAYNEAMALLPDDDYACICDYDTMFLTPNCGEILHEYAEMFPEYGLLTCWTNRIHPLASDQLYGGQLNDDDRISTHIKIAEDVQNDLYTVTETRQVVSGFLMLIPKKMWLKRPFIESGRALGVDNDYCHRVWGQDMKVGRMNGMYIWHTYRLKNGVLNKDHLHVHSLYGNNR